MGADFKRLDGIHITIDQTRFAAALTFRDDSLWGIELFLVDNAMSFSWSDWDESKELDRKSKHDRWLNSQLGTDREFSWGTVHSDFDSKSGASVIGIRYKSG